METLVTGELTMRWRLIPQLGFLAHNFGRREKSFNLPFHGHLGFIRSRLRDVELALV